MDTIMMKGEKEFELYKIAAEKGNNKVSLKWFCGQICLQFLKIKDDHI